MALRGPRAATYHLGHASPEGRSDVCAARPGRRGGRAQLDDVRRPRPPRRAARDDRHRLLPLPARRPEGRSSRSRWPRCSPGVVRARAAADAGERLLDALGHAHEHRVAAACARGCRRASGSRPSRRPRCSTWCTATPTAPRPGAGRCSRRGCTPTRCRSSRPCRCSSRSRGGSPAGSHEVEDYACRDPRPRPPAPDRTARSARAPRAARRPSGAPSPLRARVRVAAASAPRLTRGPSTPRGRVVLTTCGGGMDVHTHTTRRRRDASAAQPPRASVVALLGPVTSSPG